MAEDKNTIIDAVVPSSQVCIVGWPLYFHSVEQVQRESIDHFPIPSIIDTEIIFAIVLLKQGHKLTVRWKRESLLRAKFGWFDIGHTFVGQVVDWHFIHEFRENHKFEWVDDPEHGDDAARRILYFGHQRAILHLIHLDQILLVHKNCDVFGISRNLGLAYGCGSVDYPYILHLDWALLNLRWTIMYIESTGIIVDKEGRIRCEFGDCRCACYLTVLHF